MLLVKLQKRRFSVIQVIIIALILTSGCNESNRENPHAFNNNSAVIKSNDDGHCYNIQGYVLGTIPSGVEVFLFRCPSLEYETVMQTVRSAVPIQKGVVNDTAGFNFSCLGDGNYTTMIPSDSYLNSSVGSPLPVEFNTTNASLITAFQGGDSDYLVGAFSIVTLK